MVCKIQITFLQISGSIFGEDYGENEMGITIESPGIMSTVQDMGRIGYGKYGFGTNGVMDKKSFRMANMLLSNDENEAVIEATLMGPAIRFDEAELFTICGGNFTPTLDGVPIQNYHVYLAKAGSILRLGYAKSGARAYISFAGGLDIPLVMGSRSTNLKCGIGGFEGRMLKAGDRIGFREPKTYLINMYKRWDDFDFFSSKEIELRVVEGPQDDRFDDSEEEIFYSNVYEAGNESDRMGFRLDGAPIPCKKGVNIISDAIAEGSIQIPSSGKPIIMMADRQTTGGYAKIGTVISTDIPLLAQSLPGVKIRFKKVSLIQAVRIKKREERFLKRFKRSVN